MTNKYTQDMTGTGDHITLPAYKEMIGTTSMVHFGSQRSSEGLQLELFPELIQDPEPERYYDWMMWKLRSSS